MSLPLHLHPLLYQRYSRFAIPSAEINEAQAAHLLLIVQTTSKEPSILIFHLVIHIRSICAVSWRKISCS
jgi:hypothetical protein